MKKAGGVRTSWRHHYRHVTSAIWRRRSKATACPNAASVAARIEFWHELHERLAQLSNRLDAETRGKVMVAVHAGVPMVTPQEQPAS
jgi:hypothetical protein